MKKRLLFLVFFLAIGICAYAGEGQRLIAEAAVMVSKIKPQIDMEKLYADKLQTYIVEMPAEEGRQRRRVVGVILINAPWTEVRETLNNWEAMPEYVAHLEYYRVKYPIQPKIYQMALFSVDLLKGGSDSPSLSLQPILWMFSLQRTTGQRDGECSKKKRLSGGIIKV